MEKNITIIITMAGLGTRFRKAGYNCPKYKIEARGKTLFEWAMDSLKGFRDHASRYVFVVRAEDGAADFIREKCRAYEIFRFDIVELDKVTQGQADTCMLAVPYCNVDNPILIYNIDTYVEPYEMRYESICGDGYLPCFHAPGTHWSFVKLDGDGRVMEVREKERISDNCTLGAYYFSSAKLYQELYEEYYTAESAAGSSCNAGSRNSIENGWQGCSGTKERGGKEAGSQSGKEAGGQDRREAGEQGHNEIRQQEHKEALGLGRKERYIAPLYQLMVEKGMRVEISIVAADKVHVLGTPEELEEFINEER